MNRRDFVKKSVLAAALFSSGKVIAEEKGESHNRSNRSSGKRQSVIKKIGLEEHWGNRELGEIMTSWNERTKFPSDSDPSGGLYESIAKLSDFEKYRLPGMDKHGISIQVLATGSPGIQGVQDTAKAIDLAKRVNDEQAEIVGRYPGRFAAFAALPTQDPKAAVKELERTVTQYGFKGTMIQGHFNESYLDEKEYWPLWECLEAHGVPLYLHVTNPPVDQIRIYKEYPELLGSTWNWGVEAATHALRMVCSGLFDAFPKATLILGHMGETLPYVLSRLDEGYGSTMARKRRKIKKMPSDYIKENIMVTTSGWYLPATLRCAIDALGADRVLYSTDYPFRSFEEQIQLVENTPLSDEEKEKVYHVNAERLLGL